MKSVILGITVLIASYIPTDHYLRVLLYFFLKSLSIPIRLLIVKTLNLLYRFIIPLLLTGFLIKHHNVETRLPDLIPHRAILVISSPIVVSPDSSSYFFSFFTRNSPKAALTIYQAVNHAVAISKIVLLYSLFKTFASMKDVAAGDQSSNSSFQRIPCASRRTFLYT